MEEGLKIGKSLARESGREDTIHVKGAGGRGRKEKGAPCSPSRGPMKTGRRGRGRSNRDGRRSMETERPCEKRGERELFFFVVWSLFPLSEVVSCEGPGTLCRPC